MINSKGKVEKPKADIKNLIALKDNRIIYADKQSNEM
mgnify:FL=1